MRRTRRSAEEGQAITTIRPRRRLACFHRRTHVKDLLRLGDLCSEDLGRLQRLAIEFAAEPARRRNALAGQTVLCWFTDPSFQVPETVSTAVNRLGGAIVVLNPEELHPSRIGSLENTGRVLSSLGQAVVVGGLTDHDLIRLAAAATVPIVNTSSEGHNPCEALAQLFTVEWHFSS
jgi:ornithine carbamoyltransferase